MKKLFIYGTLKAGWAQKKDVILGDYAMMISCGIPAIFPAEGYNVVGNIQEYESEVVYKHLDKVEQHPHWYKRTGVIVDGELVETYVGLWILRDSIDGRARWAPEISPNTFHYKPWSEMSEEERSWVLERREILV